MRDGFGLLGRFDFRRKHKIIVDLDDVLIVVDVGKLMNSDGARGITRVCFRNQDDGYR